MADVGDPMEKISPQHQDIVNSTWSQLLSAEGGVQNLAADLLKNFANQSQQSGGDSANSGDFMNQLGGLAAGMLSGNRGQQSQNSGDFQESGNQRAGRAGGGGGGGDDLLGQLGGLASQFLNNRNRPNQSDDGGANGGYHGNQNNGDGGGRIDAGGGGGGGGGGNFFDQFGGLDNIAGMVSRGLGGQGGGGTGGGGNLSQSLGGLGALAALAGVNLNDPSSLLKFFMKTPLANDAANPDNSSRDIYKMIKNVIFGLLSSKLPVEDFQENPENKSAWKSFLGVIANALRKMAA